MRTLYVMASKIVLSDLAPAGASHFSLGQYEITVPTETSDARLISEASVHPWLDVETDVSDTEYVDTPSPHVAPQDDPLSADYQGNIDTVDAPAPEPLHPVAIDAGLDQSESVEAGDTAVTLAAADEVAAADEPAEGEKE